MSKRNRWIVILGAAVLTLLVLIVLHDTLTEWEFFIFLAGLLLIPSLLEPLVINRRGDSAGGGELTAPHRDETAVVTDELAPDGKVRVGAEIWNARSSNGATIAAGLWTNRAGPNQNSLPVENSRRSERVKLARLLMPVVVLGTSILVPTPRVDATGGLACGEEPVTIEPDGAVSSGSKAELTKAVRAGLPIRVGWELDWNEDGNVDVTHWAEAIFLTLFEDEVFTQIADIHRQIPRTGEKRIDLSSRPQRWTASIGTNGVLASRFDDEPVTERRVKSFWCVDER